MEGVELEIRADGAARRSPRKALARKTGARGLRSILEQSLLDTMFELPDARQRRQGRASTSTPSRTTAKPLLIYREQAKVSA